MDELIRNRNAKLAAFQQEIDTLKETLSNSVKEKESLSTTLNVFKTESKEKESKYIEKDIALEKQNKEVENIISPSELPKVSLVNESLKKLKYHLASFDKVVKKRTTSDAITTDEITEVQTVFNQMEAVVDQCSVDKNALEIQIKQLSIDNDQLLNQIMENVVDTAVSKPSATIAPGMFKLDIEPISHRLKNNRDAHEVYLEKTIENTDTLRGLVECARKQNPSEPLLESACMFTKHVQELLVYVSKTCPSLTKPTEKLVVVTPMNKDKKLVCRNLSLRQAKLSQAD
ncbi:hypothetical protein Tco_0843516 [Tanacetum coccineum]|uniref:Uncharacterized protein n=1 Tax=Tanacetum coccineum TaxID=301880 RepID=A0ABQ5B836_9ASTR